MTETVRAVLTHLSRWEPREQMLLALGALAILGVFLYLLLGALLGFVENLTRNFVALWRGWPAEEQTTPEPVPPCPCEPPSLAALPRPAKPPTEARRGDGAAGEAKRGPYRATL